MNAVKEKVVEFKERKEEQPSNSSESHSLGTAKNEMVGFEDELIQLKDRLTGQPSNLQIIPIVGMGGIGKTTLAKNMYENPDVERHFDVRAWVSISQNFSLNNILSELGSCILNKEISKSSAEFACETNVEIKDGELGLKLYQSLLGRRYLIVLDDMWSIEVWEKIKFYFPNDGNRSRVVITSRISNITADLTSSSLERKLLDEDNCWKLFCREVFLGDGYPPELEEMGMNIVGECKGLPLSIVVVGGLLRSSPRTVEHWEKLARDIKSCLMSGNGNCLDILSLSYYHLPAHLKPCFLYMGAYNEDENILFSNLIRSYVGKGFLESASVDEQKHGKGFLKSYQKLLLDLEGVIQDMNAVQEKVLEFKQTNLQTPQCSMPATPSKPLTTEKNAMVGLDDEMIQLMDRLT